MLSERERDQVFVVAVEQHRRERAAREARDRALRDLRRLVRELRLAPACDERRVATR